MTSRVTSSLAVQAAGVGLRAVISFALMTYLGRVLGTGDFGHYVAVLNGAILALILIETGWPTLLYREGATTGFHPARLQELTGLALGTAILATTILAATAWVSGATNLAAALLCMGLVAVSNIVSARMHGAGQFGREALWQVALRSTSALAIVVCVAWVSRSAAALFLAWTLGLAIVLPFGARWLAWPRWHGWLGGMVAAAPFLAYEGLTTFLTKGDMAILGLLHLPKPQLSWYAATSRLMEFSLLAFEPVLNVLLRHLRQTSEDPRQLMRITRLALGAAFGIGAVAVVASVAFGTPAMRLLFGPEYAEAGSLLPWIAAILPFALGNLVLFQLYLAESRERELALLLGGAAMMLLAALVVGAHESGARGAAIGVLAVHAVVFLFAATRTRTLRPAAAAPHASALALDARHP